jgi:hypothetical protein
MIIHRDTLISEDLLEKHFICNLEKCKGACCVEGEFGAPLTEAEITLLQAELEQIKPYLSKEGQQALDKYGVWEKDSEGDLVTTCLPSGECNFSIYDNGILGCGIEKAWKEGKTTFRKPVSCHLYPIRVSQVGDYEALNYSRWEICKPACTLGNKHQVPIYKFLKEALIRKYGENWYKELEELAGAYLEQHS